MNNFRDIMAATNGEMAARQVRSLGEEFRQRFGLLEGDYLEVLGPAGEWRPCRVLMVQDCYENEGGGWTARLTVAKLLRDGKVGTGRSLTVTINSRKFSGVGVEVRRAKT